MTELQKKVAKSLSLEDIEKLSFSCDIRNGLGKRDLITFPQSQQMNFILVFPSVQNHT